MIGIENKLRSIDRAHGVLVAPKDAVDNLLSQVWADTSNSKGKLSKFTRYGFSSRSRLCFEGYSTKTHLAVPSNNGFWKIWA